MPSTVLDILYAAALELNAVQLGEPLTAEEQQAMLGAWNRFIDSDNTVQKNVFARKTSTYTLSAGVPAYSFGEDPNDVGSNPTKLDNRPVKVTEATYKLAGGGIESALLVSKDQSDWARVSDKSIPGVPSMLYFDGGSPVETMYIYPVPSSDITLTLYTWSPISQQSELTDYVSFPPGYERRFVKRIAIECATILGVNPSQTLVATAQEAEGNVQSFNSRAPRLRSGDAALRGRSGGGWSRTDFIGRRY